METIIISNHASGKFTGSRIAIDNFKNSLSSTAEFSEIILGQDWVSQLIWKIPKLGKWLIHILIPYYVYLIAIRRRKKTGSQLLFVYPMSSTLKVAWIYSLLSKKSDISLWYHNSYCFNRFWRIYFLLESYFLKRMNNIYFISDALGELYRESFDMEYSILGHVIDPPKDTLAKIPGNELVLGVSGTINDSCLAAFQELLNVFGNRAGVKIHYIGNELTKSAFNCVRRNQINNLRHVRNIPFEDAMKSVHAHIVLLSSDGILNQTEYQTIFPTRLIEIVKSGRVIVAVCGKESFLRKELKNHTNAMFLDELIPQNLNEIKKKIFSTVLDYKHLCAKYSSESIYAAWFKCNS